MRGRGSTAGRAGSSATGADTGTGEFGITHASGHGLRVTVRGHEDLVLVCLSGPLDIYTVPDFRRSLEAHGRAGGQIVIDLAEVSLIDSSGLGALLSLRNQVKRDGPGRLGLVCPQRHLLRVFEITGLRQAFSFGSDLAAVRAALGGHDEQSVRGRRDAHKAQLTVNPAWKREQPAAEAI